MPRRKSLPAAVAESRLDGLRALRDRLARDIEACESLRDVAALSQRLMDVLEQIDQLDPPVIEKKETPVDEFTRRLRERESGAAHSGRLPG